MIRDRHSRSQTLPAPPRSLVFVARATIARAETRRWWSFRSWAHSRFAWPNIWPNLLERWRPAKRARISASRVKEGEALQAENESLKTTLSRLSHEVEVIKRQLLGPRFEKMPAPLEKRCLHRR